MIIVYIILIGLVLENIIFFLKLRELDKKIASRNRMLIEIVHAIGAHSKIILQHANLISDGTDITKTSINIIEKLMIKMREIDALEETPKTGTGTINIIKME